MFFEKKKKKTCFVSIEVFMCNYVTELNMPQKAANSLGNVFWWYEHLSVNCASVIY